MEIHSLFHLLKLGSDCCWSKLEFSKANKKVISLKRIFLIAKIGFILIYFDLSFIIS